MANIKHTPGPWTFKQSTVPHDGEFDFAIGAEGAPVLAEAFGRTSDGGRPPAEANAKLIAAAPELLAALSQFVAAQDAYAVADGNAAIGLAVVLRVKAEEAARAALAKAEA